MYCEIPGFNHYSLQFVMICKPPEQTVWFVNLDPGTTIEQDCFAKSEPESPSHFWNCLYFQKHHGFTFYSLFAKYVKGFISVNHEWGFILVLPQTLTYYYCIPTSFWNLILIEIYTGGGFSTWTKEIELLSWRTRDYHLGLLSNIGISLASFVSE